MALFVYRPLHHPSDGRVAPLDSPVHFFTPPCAASASQPPRTQDTTRTQDTAHLRTCAELLACVLLRRKLPAHSPSPSFRPAPANDTLSSLVVFAHSTAVPTPASIASLSLTLPGACSLLPPVLSAHHAVRRAHRHRPTSPRHPLGSYRPSRPILAVSAQPHFKSSSAFLCVLLSAVSFHLITSTASRRVACNHTNAFASHSHDAPRFKQEYLPIRVRAALYESQSTVCIKFSRRQRVSTVHCILYPLLPCSAYSAPRTIAPRSAPCQFLMITPPVRECAVHYALLALRQVVSTASESGRCARISRAVLFFLPSLIADRVKLFSTSDTHILERQHPAAPTHLVCAYSSKYTRTRVCIEIRTACRANCVKGRIG